MLYLKMSFIDLYECVYYCYTCCVNYSYLFLYGMFWVYSLNSTDINCAHLFKNVFIYYVTWILVIYYVIHLNVALHDWLCCFLNQKHIREKIWKYESVFWFILNAEKKNYLSTKKISDHFWFVSSDLLNL